MRPAHRICRATPLERRVRGRFGPTQGDRARHLRECRARRSRIRACEFAARRRDGAARFARRPRPGSVSRSVGTLTEALESARLWPLARIGPPDASGAIATRTAARLLELPAWACRRV